MNEPLKRPPSPLWWLKRGAYFQFMMRELSSLFIFAYLILFLVFLHKLSKGRIEYDAYLDFLWSRPMIAFHLVTLGFALLHTFTWFNSTPKAMVLWRGEEKLPAAALVVPQYVIWLVGSGVVFWFFLRH